MLSYDGTEMSLNLEKRDCITHGRPHFDYDDEFAKNPGEFGAHAADYFEPADGGAHDELKRLHGIEPFAGNEIPVGVADRVTVFSESEDTILIRHDHAVIAEAIDPFGNISETVEYPDTTVLRPMGDTGILAVFIHYGRNHADLATVHLMDGGNHPLLMLGKDEIDSGELIEKHAPAHTCAGASNWATRDTGAPLLRHYTGGRLGPRSFPDELAIPGRATRGCQNWIAAMWLPHLLRTEDAGGTVGDLAEAAFGPAGRRPDLIRAMALSPLPHITVARALWDETMPIDWVVNWLGHLGADAAKRGDSGNAGSAGDHDAQPVENRLQTLHPAFVRLLRTLDAKTRSRLLKRAMGDADIAAIAEASIILERALLDSEAAALRGIHPADAGGDIRPIRQGDLPVEPVGKTRTFTELARACRVGASRLGAALSAAAARANDAAIAQRAAWDAHAVGMAWNARLDEIEKLGKAIDAAKAINKKIWLDGKDGTAASLARIAKAHLAGSSDGPIHVGIEAADGADTLGGKHPVDYRIAEDSATLGRWQEQMNNCIGGYDPDRPGLILMAATAGDLMIANVEMQVDHAGAIMLKQLKGRGNDRVSAALDSDIRNRIRETEETLAAVIGSGEYEPEMPAPGVVIADLQGRAHKWGQHADFAAELAGISCSATPADGNRGGDGDRFDLEFRIPRDGAAGHVIAEIAVDVNAGRVRVTKRALEGLCCDEVARLRLELFLAASGVTFTK